MKKTTLYIHGLLAFGLVATVITSCKPDGNPNDLPDVSPADYAGKIDGYDSSDQIYPDYLVAYWSFDSDEKETKSGTAPATTSNDALIDGGVRGKALSLNGGFLYYANQFNAFKTDAFKSFTISAWVQIQNNGSKKTMLFQLARPGIFNGSLNFTLETNAHPASDTDDLSIHPTFTAVGGGTQDNINASWLATYKSPKIGPNTWTHLLLTYDGTTGIFNIWANGVKVGDYASRGTGNNLFKSYEPSEVIIGGNYNVIPGKSVSTDASYAAMTGVVDEVRVYDRVLPDAHIKALYNLGLAGK